jgi:hypothetical protein
MIYGYYWSPEILFYAGRWGYMAQPGETPDRTGYRVFECSAPDDVLAGCFESPSPR